MLLATPSSPELRYGLREENREVALPPVLVGWILSNVSDVIVGGSSDAFLQIRLVHACPSSDADG